MRVLLDAFLAAAAEGKPGKRHTATALLEGMDTITVSFLLMRELLDSLTRTAPLAIRGRQSRQGGETGKEARASRRNG